MEFGWSDSESSPRLRSRLPNLNLLPHELLPTPLPWLTAGLILLGLGLLMLLYALFYVKSYTDLEVQALRERLANAQLVARELGLPVDGSMATLPPGTLEDWAELRARQVDWASVFHVVATGLGQTIQLGAVSQAGYTITIAGEAASSNDANTYLQKLRDSGLFASLEMSIIGIEAPPAAQPTAAPVAPTIPVQPPPASKPQPTVPPQPQPPPSAAQPPAAAPPAAAKPQPPPAAAPPAAAQPTLAPRTPLATPSPVPAVVPATPTPGYDFIVQSKRETVDPSRQSDSSHIRVRVVDSAGNLIPGLRIRVESEGLPPWGDTHPHADQPASNGTFDAGVGMGKFTVFVLNGFSERATGLFTGVAGQPGVHEWDVTFTKVTPGAAPAETTCPGCSPTPSPTITLTVAPTATPISPGGNVASLACVTASHTAGGNDAPRAVDGNIDTAWESGRGPIVQITLDFTRYPNGHARACQPKAAGEPIVVQVEAMELVTRMDARSRQTHEVWTVYDTGVAQLEYTFADVDVADNTTISARFAAVRNLQQMRIRTTRSGVNVGWRELRLFEPLPPAFGNVATNTPVVIHTPTSTPTAPPGRVNFGSAQASSEHPGNPAALSIDGNPSTFWRPVANQSGQYLQANFSTAQTIQTVRFSVAMGEAIATATATVGPNTPTSTPAGSSFRVSLLRPGLTAQQEAADRRAQDNDCYTTFQAADNATAQFNCSEPFTGVTGVRVYLDSIGNPAVPPGIREVSAYLPASTPTPNATQTVAAQRTATVTTCLTMTATAVSVSAQQVPDTPTPTVTASSTTTSTATRTPTVTATATLTGDQIVSTAVAATQTSVAISTNIAATLTAVAASSQTATPTRTVTPTPTAASCGSTQSAAALDYSGSDGASIWATLGNALQQLFGATEAKAAPFEQVAQTQPTQVNIGAPQRPGAPLPSMPLSHPVAVQPQQVPTGRVSFTIIGQVRPGGQ